MEGALSVTALLCRTSDRTAQTSAGARALADAIAAGAGVQARHVGAPGTPGDTPYDEDLRTARGCLLEAGGQLEDVLAAGHRPVLTSSDCSICMTTLPALARARPDAWVLWLDAHPDFNDPDSTPSGFLGGMCLSAACGVWDAGLGAGTIDAARVLTCGIRDVDPGERVLLATSGVGRAGHPSDVAGLLAGREVFVHLDLDVLDPAVMPGLHWPVDGGLGLDDLRAVLAEVAASATIVGVEVTDFPAPELAEQVATVVEPLLA